MTTPARDFGVQSYCFRNFKDNAEVAAMAKQIGVDKVELCAVQIDFDAPDTWPDIIAAYRDAGVTLVSCGVETYVGDEQHARNRFEFAKAAGLKHLTAHFRPDTFHHAVPQVANLLDEYDLRLAIHCHGGYMFGGDVPTLKHLVDLGEQTKPGRVGVCIDTAWCMQTGPRDGNPVRWAREHFAGRVFGVHYKDFVFDKAAQWTDVVVGTGNLDLPAFVSALEETNFDGFAVIEYEAEPDNPVPALTECVRKMRELA
ncbi:MAG: sugar phosphate isomerase/epimerase family protein [Planctomycetota bacterium]